MQKFEVKRGDKKECHVMSQSHDSDIARYAPQTFGVKQKDIKVYFLDSEPGDNKLFLQDGVEVEHAKNGDVKFKKDGKTFKTLKATLKKWDELYSEDEGKKVYKIKKGK